MNKILLPFLLLTFSIVSNAQPKSISKEQSDMDSIALLIQNSYEVPGLALRVILDNQVYYSATLGVQGLNAKAPLTSSSLFHMASVSKPFVATAIMQLVESGKMSLNDKLTDHLPYFKMKDQRFQNITILQILNHSSGIPDVQDYEWDKPQYDDEAAERYAQSFTEAALDFTPGEDFSYSNAAFDILAAVIAKVSGLTFEDYMTQHIFKPIGMVNSTFYKPDVPKALATHPHGMGDDLQIEELDIYPYNRIHAPSSTLHSNIDDMTQWALAYLNKGELNGQRIFSEDTYQQLISPTIKLNKIRSVCLSWFTREFEGKSIYYHSGGDEGYRTFFGFFPENKAAIILMGNNNYFQTSEAAVYLINKLITSKPSSWKKPIHFEMKNLMLTEGIDSCKAFYYAAQKHKSDQYELGGGYIDDLGYWFLDRKKYKEALDIFLFNVELFPEDAGFVDSVGDAYRAMEDTPKAIEWYEMALKMKPDQDFTIKKLKELKD